MLRFGEIISFLLFLHFQMCSSRKNPYPPHGRSLEIPRGRGVLKAKFLEATYENILEFPRGRWGRGVAKQKFSVGGGYGYFLELHNVWDAVYASRLICHIDTNHQYSFSELTFIAKLCELSFFNGRLPVLYHLFCIIFLFGLSER